jgi:signal transduction histidine kinase
VAHDFNNLLQVIGANLEMLSVEIAGNDKLHKRVETALQAVWRSSRLASQLLAFARRQPLSPKVINLGRRYREFPDIPHPLGAGGTSSRTAGAHQRRRRKS